MEKVNTDELARWVKMTEDLKILKEKESELRKKIFGVAFPDPSEGTNDYSLSHGYILKGTYPITRKIDETALSALDEQLKEANITKEDLVAYEPKLVKKAYNKLSDAQRLIFDNALIIKPGSVSMQVVLPEKAKEN